MSVSQNVWFAFRSSSHSGEHVARSKSGLGSACGRAGEPYLKLSQGETPAGADLAVVLDSRASDNGTQLVDGARSQSSSLGLTSNTARGLLSGLFMKSQHHHYIFTATIRRLVRLDIAYLVEVGANPSLPVLAEVCWRICQSNVVVAIVVSRCNGVGCSRLLTIFWLCLIA